MGKEGKWLLVLCLIIVVLLPVTVVRWVGDEKNEDSTDKTIRVLMPDGEIEMVGLEKYLIGVVAGEMPADFEAEALKAQVEKMMHVSNYYYTENLIGAAKLLVEHSIFDKVFFCNSGAEANEGDLKLAKKYGKLKSEDKDA